MKSVAVSLLGHKDHGKSTLIGRLLVECNAAAKERVEHVRELSKSMGKDFEYAFLLDSFREERADGLTMDSTSAKLSLNGKVIELIDVPGHKELVKNMLTGASRAKYALLVASAKPGEGFQEETRLHVLLARMLGLERVVVAVTKMDMQGYSREVFDGISKSVVDYLLFVGFERSQIKLIPVSAMAGDNIKTKSSSMPWFAGKPVVEEMDSFFDSGEGEAAARRQAPARFLVQDSVDTDEGRAVLGRVEQGTLRKGDEVFFLPENSAGTIGKIMFFGRAADSAGPGENAGLLMDFGRSAFPGKGSVGCRKGEGVNAVEEMQAKLFVLPGFYLDFGKPLRVKNASGESNCRVARVLERIDFIKNTVEKEVRLEKGDSMDFLLAELECEGSAVFEEFAKTPFLGRFVVLQDNQIAAVGTVEKTSSG
ncbi:TPA: hypothetical protein HA318_02510 [Candidatus Micrarchaeota archaeon]|nr:MAG: hypothetical protein AUJ65_04385 [Candidatus Micrarchaeota archaeon CG1_02_51_15]HII38849.1 hypothetical protein [Candidatus Micrarchaeota archaeon]